jgi:hypothetical protein
LVFGESDRRWIRGARRCLLLADGSGREDKNERKAA